MKYVVPRDIKQYVLKRRLIRIIPFIILMSALILIFFLDVPFVKDISSLNKKLTLIVGAIAICSLTGVPFKIIDMTWSGEVTKVRIKTYQYSLLPGVFTTKDIRTFNEYILTVKTIKGNTIKRRAGKSPTNRASNGLQDYSVGDYVLHIGGTDNILILNQNSEQRKCVVCGTYYLSNNECCPICKHSYIKIH